MAVPMSGRRAGDPAYLVADASAARDVLRFTPAHMSVGELDGMPILSYRENTQYGLGGLSKRAVDILGSLVAIVLSLQTTGPLLVHALQSQDTYLAGSFLMFLALLTVIGVFISDLLLAALDPRIRLSGGATK